MSSTLVFTIEADPVHVAIARHFIDGVLCSSLVEVQPGMVRDVVPLVNEVFGGLSSGFLFMDQKGTTFHLDFALLNRLRWFQPNGYVVADNVVRPGAPVYCWSLTRTSMTLKPSFWSLPEFLEESAGVEDWMALSQFSHNLMSM